MNIPSGPAGDRFKGAGRPASAIDRTQRAIEARVEKVQALTTKRPTA